MTAARSATAAGYKVTLVEKEDRLGGWAARFSKVFPKSPPYKDLEDSGWEKLAEEVEADPDITVHKSTTVAKTSLPEWSAFCTGTGQHRTTTRRNR